MRTFNDYCDIKLGFKQFSVRELLELVISTRNASLHITRLLF